MKPVEDIQRLASAEKNASKSSGGFSDVSVDGHGGKPAKKKSKDLVEEERNAVHAEVKRQVIGTRRVRKSNPNKLAESPQAKPFV